jgi:hypothetical protein
MGQMPNNWRVLTVQLADISADTSAWIVSPCDGYIKEIWSTISAAITGADCTITATIGSTAVTGGVITVTQSGSAAGDVDVCYPTAANYVTKGQVIQLDSGGESSTTSIGTFTIVIAD